MVLARNAHESYVLLAELFFIILTGFYAAIRIWQKAMIL